MNGEGRGAVGWVKMGMFVTGKNAVRVSNQSDKRWKVVWRGKEGLGYDEEVTEDCVEEETT